MFESVFILFIIKNTIYTLYKQINFYIQFLSIFIYKIVLAIILSQLTLFLWNEHLLSNRNENNIDEIFSETKRIFDM